MRDYQPIIMRDAIGIALSLSLVTATTAILFQVHAGHAAPQRLVYAYLLPLVWIAMLYSGWIAAMYAGAAIVCGDYFLQEPIYSFYTSEYKDLAGFAALAATEVKLTQSLFPRSSGVRLRRRTRAFDLSAFSIVILAALLYCYEFEVFPRDHKLYAIEPDELLLLLIISCCGVVICAYRALTAERDKPSYVLRQQAFLNYLPFPRTLSDFTSASDRRDVLSTLSRGGVAPAKQATVDWVGRSGEVAASSGSLTSDREVSLKTLTRDEWDKLAPAFRDLSYRQCSSYAVTAAENVGAQPEFIGIFDGQKLVGLASVRVKTLPFSFPGLAYINYGPLTARNAGFSTELFDNCLTAIRKEYVERRRLVLRIVPPLRGGGQQQAQAACLEAHGFRPLGVHARHETLILDLSGPLNDIRKQFDRKWRNHLSKAERANITITRSNSVLDFDRLEPIFSNLMREKRFFTRQDVSFFRRVQENAHSAQEIVIHLAWNGNELLAGHIGSFVGDTAVYLLGASNSKGRALRASYLVQWAVIEYAKRMGNVFYDLGGIDPQNNPGVFAFKNGLRARRVAEVVPYELAHGHLSGLAVHVVESTYNGVVRMLKGVSFAAHAGASTHQQQH